MMREEITSLQNPKVKKAVKLADRKERNETQLFLIEGYRELKRACDSGVSIQTLFICPKLFLGSNENTLIEDVRKAGAEVILCNEQVFHKLSYRDRPDGLVAIAVQMQRQLRDLVAMLAAKKDPFLIIAEAIEKPGNLGTILRSADAAGVDGVIVCDRCTDIYNPNVVRASVGTLFTIPVVEATSAETLLWLQQRKIKVVAATPSAKEEFTDTDLTGGVAIAVGTEQLGLTELWMNASDIKVRIPMHGVADSLNVATATTLLLYEVVRQRKGGSNLWK
ncbi:MAG: RNA methyltransferase [Verrucomicrobia bacterium]|nr:RNA methyltransferase [Verrucomicrobiota bacterium]